MNTCPECGSVIQATMKLYWTLDAATGTWSLYTPSSENELEYYCGNDHILGSVDAQEFHLQLGAEAARIDRLYSAGDGEAPIDPESGLVTLPTCGYCHTSGHTTGECPETPVDDERYIAFTVMARYDGRDQRAIEQAIERALGCPDPDKYGGECPMVECSSTVGTLDMVSTWLHGPDEGIPNSSIPEAIATIVSEALGGDTTEATNNEALDRLAVMMREPEYGVGMLEDIARIVADTGRDVATRHTVRIVNDEGEAQWLCGTDPALPLLWTLDEGAACRYTDEQLDALDLPDDADIDAVATWDRH